MKQITMNGTANALQVVAVLFLFGNSIFSPVDRSKKKEINKAGTNNIKQNDVEERKFNNFKVGSFYFQEGTINAIKPLPAGLPSPQKKNGIQTVEK